MKKSLEIPISEEIYSQIENIIKNKVGVMLLGKIKLYDIAKEFDMSSKDILAIAVKLNIDAKSHLSSVSDEDAERIRKEAKNTNKTKQNNVKKIVRN